MGFGERFIGLVFGIISNNWYSVMLNGQPYGFFKSTRGVKQGDPISPTLFIIAAEALSRGLNALHLNLHFCGFGLPKWSPKINHLAYADDSIIFSSSDETSLQLIMAVLSDYEAASGQLINKAKSVVYLHHNAPINVVNKVVRISGIDRQDFPFTYLGCPIYYAKRKMNHYQGLITKVMNKLQTWKGKLLSVGGSTVGGTSRHWSSWTNLCLPSDEGGIGFRSLHDVSKALFCKLWWNFRTKPSLWSSFVSQKYCKKLNPIIVPWRDGSHIWRRMLECRDIVEHQIGWHPRMGSSLFWYENWTGLGALYFITPPDLVIDESVNNVHEVVRQDTWDVDKLVELLPEEIVEHIVDNIRPPAASDIVDKPFWMLETRESFSVKSDWDFLRRRKDPAMAYKKMWVHGLPFKISFFLWKVWKAKLPLDDWMRRLGYFMPSKCWCCAQEQETLMHLFFTSFAATRVWTYFLTYSGFSMEGLTLHQAIVKCWTTKVVHRLQPILQALPAIIVWELWKRRNSQKYGEMVTINRFIYQVSTTLQMLVKIRKPSMQNVPHKWPDLIQKLEQYTPQLKVTKVIWEKPNAGWIKINTDGASRGDTGRSSIGYVIRDDEENVMYALDSMLLRNILEGKWEAPRNINEDVVEIKMLMEECNVRASHILREGNSLADYIANCALDNGDFEAQGFAQLDSNGDLSLSYSLGERMVETRKGSNQPSENKIQDHTTELWTMSKAKKEKHTWNSYGILSILFNEISIGGINAMHSFQWKGIKYMQRNRYAE
ncbi:uncharacterized protein [Nicotiana sylvestris]|uniref:uncharacterized protein n=1 Tax=Nicotiana sylvestris TaxID=4096 RepID=UPI00388C6580